MNFLQKFISVGVLTVGLVFSVAAQGTEMSIEESFLKESVAIKMISEQAKSDDRDGKQLALDYVKDLFDSGGNKEEAMPVLVQLSGEGTLSQTRTEGRISNDFPDVRMRACEYLGEIGTVDASKRLVNIIQSEKEPAVITEAVRAITKIGVRGYSDGERYLPLDAVNFIFNHYNSVQPDNRFAYAVIQAAASLIPQMGNTPREQLAKQGTLEILGRITKNHNYVPITRNMAAQTQKDLVKSLQNDK
jgi:hypothetical protein